MGIESSTLALAGAFQAVELFRQIARQGHCGEEPFAVSIGSIFKLDANSTADVYGGVANLQTGLRSLLKYLRLDIAQHDHEMVRYMLEIMFIERKLVKSPRLLENIRQSIIEYSALPYTSPETLEKLAQLYLDTLSTFSYRIHVHGKKNFLAEQENANKIRALLLAAIRSIVLWRQTGGGRIQLLFSRKKIIKQAEKYLQGTLH